MPQLLDESAVLTHSPSRASQLELNRPPRYSKRRNSSIVLQELKRALTTKCQVRAPWNATAWRHPVDVAPETVDRQVTLAREELARYDASFRAPRKAEPQLTPEMDAAFIAGVEGVLGSTVAVDIVDEKLEAFATAKLLKSRATYTKWDAQVYRPLTDDIANAIDTQAAEEVRRRAAEAAARTAASLTALAAGQEPPASNTSALYSNTHAIAGTVRSPLKIRSPVPLTLRDPLKRVLVKKLEEEALTHTTNDASLSLPLAQSREILSATFWSKQALSSTPHGYHLSQRDFSKGGSISARHRERASGPHLDDFSRAVERDLRGRAVHVDSMFPRGKRILRCEKEGDTRLTIQQPAAEGLHEASLLVKPRRIASAGPATRTRQRAPLPMGTEMYGDPEPPARQRPTRPIAGPVSVHLG